MDRLLGDTNKDADEVAAKYIHDPKIIKTLAVLYAMDDSAVKGLVQLYRLYYQIISEVPEAAKQSNIVSMIENTISSPSTRNKFEFDIQKAVLSSTGLELFIKLIVGRNGEEPIIGEVRKGERTLGDYIKVLKEGSKEDVERIEVAGEESGVIAGEIKARKGDNKSLKRIVSRMAKDLEQLKLVNIKKEDLTQADFDVLEDLKKHLDKLLGAIGNK